KRPSLRFAAALFRLPRSAGRSHLLRPSMRTCFVREDLGLRRCLVPALALGVILRVAALPTAGAGDVGAFTLWSYHAVHAGAVTLYGSADPPHDTIFRFGNTSAV